MPDLVETEYVFAAALAAAIGSGAGVAVDFEVEAVTVPGMRAVDFALSPPWQEA